MKISFSADCKCYNYFVCVFVSVAIFSIRVFMFVCLFHRIFCDCVCRYVYACFFLNFECI